MFRKGLFVLALLSGLSSTVYSNEVCGWSGPWGIRTDSGHVALIDSICTQGNFCLNFVIWYDSTDTTLYPWHWMEFKKHFDLVTPDSIKWDQTGDSTICSGEGGITVWIRYQDSLWEAGKQCGVGDLSRWYTHIIGSAEDGYLNGTLWEPSYVYPCLPPGHIDTLIFRMSGYGASLWDPEQFDISIFVDNIRFYYQGQETLVDGMGDTLHGIEESVEAKTKIEIWPNPFTNYLRIKAYEAEIFPISIFNVAGEQVFVWRKETSVWKPKARGIYFLKGKGIKVKLIKL